MSIQALYRETLEEAVAKAVAKEKKENVAKSVGG